MQNHTQIEHKTKEFNIVCLFKKYHIWTQNEHYDDTLYMVKMATFCILVFLHKILFW